VPGLEARQAEPGLQVAPHGVGIRTLARDAVSEDRLDRVERHGQPTLAMADAIGDRPRERDRDGGRDEAGREKQCAEGHRV
jgi:hypothetical protein